MFVVFVFSFRQHHANVLFFLFCVFSLVHELCTLVHVLPQSTLSA
jgi:hypothetical protein